MKRKRKFVDFIGKDKQSSIYDFMNTTNVKKRKKTQ